MPAINDYRCVECEYIDRDRLEKATHCPNCDAENSFEVTFINWRGIEVDTRHDERCDSHGNIKQFGVLDCPLSSAQLGLGDAKLQSFKRISDEQSRELREKLMKDGDSRKLRREVLNKYNEETGKKMQMED